MKWKVRKSRGPMDYWNLFVLYINLHRTWRQQSVVMSKLYDSKFVKFITRKIILSVDRQNLASHIKCKWLPYYRFWTKIFKIISFMSSWKNLQSQEGIKFHKNLLDGCNIKIMIVIIVIGCKLCITNLNYRS